MTSEREDQPTVAMNRQLLLGLLAESLMPEYEERPASPIAILFVLALLTSLFVAIVKLI